jgi:hypothetical protein
MGSPQEGQVFLLRVLGRDCLEGRKLSLLQVLRLLGAATRSQRLNAACN